MEKKVYECFLHRKSYRRERFLKESKIRPCLRCGADFRSAGPHNRLCPLCIRTIREECLDHAFDL